jgi:hypothetical protein
LEKALKKIFRKIASVARSGKLISKAQLQKMLAGVEAAAGGR